MVPWEAMVRRSARLGSAGLAAAVLLLAATASADAVTVAGKSGPLSASMVPGTHHPKDTGQMSLKVTATLDGKPAHATAVYEFLYYGAIVSTQYPRYNKHFTFTGHFSDELGPFGAASKGEPLTLRVVIAADGHTVDLDWAITTVV
jgi:hypothetical protein